MNVSASKWPSGKGSCSARPATSPIRPPLPAAATRRRPCRSISSVRSTPTTLTPPRASSCSATPAVPDATSRITPPAVPVAAPSHRPRSVPRPQNMIDHGRTPSSVLPEGQDLGQPVVPGGQRTEQVTREAVGTRKVCGHDGPLRRGTKGKKQDGA